MICHATQFVSPASHSPRRDRLESTLRTGLDRLTAPATTLAHTAPALIDDAVRSEASRFTIDAWDAAARREVYRDAAEALRAIVRDGAAAVRTPLGEALAALDTLAATCPEEAETFLLRVLAGRTIDEVAELTGTTPDTAERRWYFARAWAAAITPPAA